MQNTSNELPTNKSDEIESDNSFIYWIVGIILFLVILLIILKSMGMLDFKNMSVAKKLIFGFGAIIFVLLVVVIAALLGISTASDNFNKYRGIARDSVLMGQVQASILEGRLDALKFINSSGENKQAIDKFHGNFKNLKKQGKQAGVDIKNPKRVPLVTAINDNIDAYESGFENVKDFINTRNHIIYDVLAPAGEGMVENLENMLSASYANKDSSNIYYAAKLQEHLLLARLFVLKFMDVNSKANADRVKKELKNNVDKVIQNINVKNASIKKYLSEFLKHRKVYYDDFIKLEKTIFDRNNIIKNTLDQKGPLISGNAEEVKKDIKEEQDILGPAAKASNAQTMWIIVIVSIVGFVVAILLTIMITKQITNPLGGEPNDMADLALKISKGDLTMTFDKNENRKGLYQSMVNMAENLQQVISNISEVSNNLAASSEEINATAANLSEGAQQQAASVEESSAATEELTSSIRKVAENADEMKGSSEKVLLEAQEYKVNLLQVSNEMTNISESAQKIGEIIQVINDIADQTNLLSLNAAIEAARAGEHGKGFAVVAEEISKLANRSGDSTKEIEALINDSVNRINKGVDSVKGASDSFNSIIKTIEMTNDGMVAIAQSMDEQKEGSEQIQTATEDVNNQSQSASASAEQLSSSTSELHNLAEQLNEIVSSFKIAKKSISQL